MPLYKSAQHSHSLEDEVVIFSEPPTEPHHEMLEVMEVNDPQEFQFSFPTINTGVDAPSIEVIEESDARDSHETRGPKDIWDWSGYGTENLLQWVQERISQMPTHSGETSGIERTISYLKKLNGEISKAIATDFEGKINVGTLEGARRWIYQSINKLEVAHENQVAQHYKRQKAASGDAYGKMVKEAGTAYTGGMVVSVPLLISRIARMLVNGSISGGMDVVSMYEDQVKKFDLTMREQAELTQHLADLGFPVMGNRGLLPGDEVIVGNGTGELPMGYYS